MIPSEAPAAAWPAVPCLKAINDDLTEISHLHIPALSTLLQLKKAEGRVAVSGFARLVVDLISDLRHTLEK